jgi:PAS domain S-box-containing protein
VSVTDGRFIGVNAAFCRMLGYTEEELKRLTFSDVTHPEHRSTDVEAVKRLWAGQIPQYKTEKRYLRKSGEALWAALTASIICSEDGKPLYAMAMIEDISERKRAEVERNRLEAQLRESQKMEALGTLAGGVAHDFNNVLTAITGNTELARQDVGPDHPALESLEEIGKASRRAKDLVQQILSFGRRKNFDRKPTSLALIVVESSRLIRASLPVGVSLKVDCMTDTPAVSADTSQVQQILLNLGVNAAQAVQGQGNSGVIEVSLCGYDHTQGKAHRDLRPGRYACLTVRDNGPGMDEATRSRIFEPFFTTKQVGNGTGLGLSVVHSIVQAHEASIEVESAPGEGSTFRIYIPAIDAPVAEIVAPTPGIAPVHGKGKHVLYVDDEEAIIFLMKRLLERQGYRVSCYTDPKAALAAARTSPDEFDLVVTDYNMPGMSGLQVAEALKEIRADLPVVLASGYITEELRQKAPAAGVRELIYKPNTVDELCAAVARFSHAQSANEISS